MYNIYVLKCPITNDIRYVGQTRMKLAKRLSGHLYDALSRDKVRLNHKELVQNITQKSNQTLW